MTDDPTETQPDSSPDSGEGVAERFAQLRERMSEIIAETDDAKAWFAMWGPVFSAVLGLGKTLAKLVFRLRQLGSGESNAAPLDDELQEELLSDVRAIRDDFPDVAEVFFGMDNVDKLADAIARDVTARKAAKLVLDSVTALIDRTVNGLIDVALGTTETSFGPERVVEVLERYEEIAQRLLDNWLLPTMSGVEPEETDDSNP